MVLSRRLVFPRYIGCYDISMLSRDTSPLEGRYQVCVLLMRTHLRHVPRPLKAFIRQKSAFLLIKTRLVHVPRPRKALICE